MVEGMMKDVRVLQAKYYKEAFEIIGMIMMNFTRDIMPIVKEILAKNGIPKIETEMKKHYF
jgi:hypothetical protein